MLPSQNQCSVAICQSNGKHKSNAGAIAGGVVGGIVGLLLLISLGLWFYFKNRRTDDETLLDEEYEHMSLPYDKRQYRPSVAASIATVNTNQARESNVIPVAYIPGVSVLPTVPERGSGMPTIRNSIATTNYRASVPDMVMAVQGQPNLIHINGDGGQSNSTLNSSRPSAAPVSRQSSLISAHGSQRSAPGLPARYAWADTVDAVTNASNSMVTIPEDMEHVPLPGHRGLPPTSGASGSLNSSRRSSTWRTADRMSTVSRASSNGEYMLQLPEEAYLYHGGGFDNGSNRATLPEVYERPDTGTEPK